MWGFYFNQNRCLGCKTCVTACKNWNDRHRGDALVNAYAEPEAYMVKIGEPVRADYYINPEKGSTNYEYTRKFYMKENWRRITDIEMGNVLMEADGTFTSNLEKKYISVGCNHCEEPACMDACPNAIITKDAETGAVLVASELCISCGRCKSACPWDAPQFYDDNFAQYALSDPARPVMTKCNLCLDRVREGLRPACVAACWNRALDADTMDNLRAKYAGAVTELDGFPTGATSELGIDTKPNILFRAKRG